MEWNEFRSALVKTYYKVDDHHLFQMAAALTYYFFLAIFPAWILLSLLLVDLPVHRIAQHIFVMANQVSIAREMGLNGAIGQAITARRATFLSVGMIGILWTTSSGFAAIIEALNITYDAKETRAFWITRPLSVALTFSVGALVFIAGVVLTVGPHFGEWLTRILGLPWLFALLWPYIHWTTAVGFAVIAVEGLYFLAPNVKQRFLATLPGAIFSISSWLGLTYLLGIYFRSFADFSQTYGTLGAAVALMEWLYWTSFAMLLGAQWNAELAKVSDRGRIVPVAPRSSSCEIAPPSVEEGAA